ncbi:hypothetical protein LXT21_09035 [Myxococcus sp. K38C18041901]|uniref:hypothetical protein n=1 Tax=Myxococcus guangdongensis TaxID=2906760 RepID=UPI0020A70B7B|nr:hypothetical protein [Myxococcus guangdongensis]MCP3058914.1 hypothetical protein [Myxococcus guangdongensis]
MRDVVDADKRALATHRGVRLPLRAEHLRGARAQPLSAASGGKGVWDILRALVSRDPHSSIHANGEHLHGDEAPARHLDNVHLLMSRFADRGNETDWKWKSCGNGFDIEADWTRDVAQRDTSHGSLREV